MYYIVTEMNARQTQVERRIETVEEALRRLGLSQGVTFAEIRRAYRAHAKALHPDRQGEDSTAQMVALNRAYETLRRFYRTAEPGRSRR